MCLPSISLVDMKTEHLSASSSVTAAATLRQVLGWPFLEKTSHLCSHLWGRLIAMERHLKLSRCTFILFLSEAPNRKRAASSNVSGSSARVTKSLLRSFLTFYRLSLAVHTETFSRTNETAFAASAADCEVSIPFSASSSIYINGATAFRFRVYSLAAFKLALCCPSTDYPIQCFLHLETHMAGRLD